MGRGVRMQSRIPSCELFGRVHQAERRRSSHSPHDKLQIGLREIPADAEERPPGHPSCRVRETIAIVQARRMPATPEAKPRIHGDSEVSLRERDDIELELLEQSSNESSRIPGEPGRKHDRGLDECGGTYSGGGCQPELTSELGFAGFLKDDRDDRRAVDDHTPAGP